MTIAQAITEFKAKKKDFFLGKCYSIWNVRGGDVRVPEKIPRVGGLDNFPMSRVGSLIFFAIPMGGGMLGTPQHFMGWLLVSCI